MFEQTSKHFRDNFSVCMTLRSLYAAHLVCMLRIQMVLAEFEEGLLSSCTFISF